jgi:hypothetical protein
MKNEKRNPTKKEIETYVVTLLIGAVEENKINP